MLKFLRCVVVALMLMPTIGAAQDFQAGLAAYDTGDYATALSEWRPFAEQGYAPAQFNLGLMYGNGQGVLQDYAEAVKWYRLAAEQGNSQAQSNLAFMYGNGQGVLQDYAEAIRWNRLAAGQGNAQAQYNLGVMYANGQGVVQSYVIAHMWFNIAAANGDRKAFEKRDLTASRMTAEAIVEAQQRASVCMNSGYQDCD